jgi:hypothetical protein
MSNDEQVMSAEELKGCPFISCTDAGSSVTETYCKSRGSRYFVECHGCGASGPLADSPYDACKEWNTRSDALIAPHLAKIKRLEDELLKAAEMNIQIIEANKVLAAACRRFIEDALCDESLEVSDTAGSEGQRG